MPGLISEANFRGKTLFVAGGSSGINLGIAERFAQQGAKVAICSRKRDKIDAAVKLLKSHGAEAIGHVADVRDFAQVEAAIKATHHAFGEIDFVVSGAAGNFVAPALGISPNGFKVVIDIDLIGTFHVMRAAFDYLKKPGASLINISAPQSLSPYAYQSHVCAAKAGVDMLTRTLAIEWGPLGVRINSIVPGPIEDTEGMARLAPTAQARQAAIDGTPMRRYGTKYEIGDACLFLCSPMAAYITGAVIPVDGGMALMGGGGVLGSAMQMAFDHAKQASAKP
ncbi:MAG: SDR family oxidoreductase [Alphaproteobacteria bacterium]